MYSLKINNETPSIPGYSKPIGWANAVFCVEALRHDGVLTFFYVTPGAFYCCGMAGLSRYSGLLGLAEEDMRGIYTALKKAFYTETRMEGRVTGYRYNQLFCADKDGNLEKYPLFMEIFNVKKEMTWQSGSEPNHRTALYSINFV